jgi:chlorite dismutase
MPEQTPRTLSHYAVISFTDAYWNLGSKEREEFHNTWLAGLRDAATRVDIYQVFPAQNNLDIMVWSTLEADDPNVAAEFFERFARATNPFRNLLKIDTTLWGYTRPSQYTKTRSNQEIDPFATDRQRYLIVYPFVKTKEWYLLSSEARQGMMNGHIKVGKQFEDITQLLLYSFGVQDQEFVVVYETEDIRRFSDLVAQLRTVDGRLYTERDTPLHTGFYHPAEKTLALFR